MKKYSIYIFLVLLICSCSGDFLERLPKGYYHHGNFVDSVDVSLVTEAQLMTAYSDLRSWDFVWAANPLHSFSSPDAEKGSIPGNEDVFLQFKTMTFSPATGVFAGYYSNAYSVIRNANKVLIGLNAAEVNPRNTRLMSEALFLRSLMYFRLTQAYGDVPWIDVVLGQNENTPPRTAVSVIYTNIIEDLLQSIPNLPTRVQNNNSGNPGRATQNAARALLAKIYLYQKDYASVLTYTSAIIASGDNNLTTPYDQIFDEDQEFGPESVLEVNCDYRPSLEIRNGSQYAQIQGVRGVPNLGWGFNAPSASLENAYEVGDPRKRATIIFPGENLEGDIVIAAVGSMRPYFNKKVYVKKAERNVFGRSQSDQGEWKNIRLIRYADILLMHAEAANEIGDIEDALAKLEMIRSRARGSNPDILPKITEQSKELLRTLIRNERRIELAMEFERYFDLVRWGIAKDVIPNFVVGKHEVYPIPQNEIDKSNGVLIQNPNY